MLNQLEIYYISLYQTQTPNGYNISIGGNMSLSHVWTLEEKEKKSLEYGVFTKEEIIQLRLAYQNHESPTYIYNTYYKDWVIWPSFMNIWVGARYKTIMPEVFSKNKRHTKLTKETVQKIRQEHQELKLSYSDLAFKYNISKSTVADIIKRRTWKNI